jgi:hypothetical protein
MSLKGAFRKRACLCKEAKSKTSTRTSLREICFALVLFSKTFPCPASLSSLSLSLCANHSAPDPDFDLEGSPEKQTTAAMRKTAGAAAAVAWMIARQNRHGARVHRPITQQEHIEDGCRERELRRNALGCGLAVKDKCDLLLIHAC